MGNPWPALDNFVAHEIYQTLRKKNYFCKIKATHHLHVKYKILI